MKNIYLLIIGSFILASCGSRDTKEEETKKIELSDAEYNGATITINQALQKGYVSVSGNGQGTYTQLEVDVKNLTNKPLNIEINSGLNFNNPNPEAQSLIIIEKIGVVSIQPDESYKKYSIKIPRNLLDIRY